MKSISKLLQDLNPLNSHEDKAKRWISDRARSRFMKVKLHNGDVADEADAHSES